LSIAARFVDIDTLELTHRDRETETYHALATFASGRGRIVTTWGGLEPAKHTMLQFADGAVLVLDHQAVAAVLSHNGRVVETFMADRARTRLQWHYVGLFERAVRGERLFDRATDRRLHELLLGA
jgi:hypothetical protein